MIAGDEAVVHPDARQGLPTGPFTLRNLVLVMGKLQVSTAAMNINRIAQQAGAHGRTLYMPTRTARAPQAVPLHFLRLLRLGRLPQHKIQRVILALGHRHPFTGAQVIKRLATQATVRREFAHSVVDVAVGARVGQALVHQLPYEREHLRHVVSGAGLVVRALYAKGIGILVQGLDHAVGQGPNSLAILESAADDLVVNVGDVAHIAHTKATGLEPALHHIKGHHGAGMPEVAQVIHRHATHIHAHVAGLDRQQRHHGTRQGAVNSKAHGSIKGARGTRDEPRRAQNTSASEAMAAGVGGTWLSVLGYNKTQYITRLLLQTPQIFELQKKPPPDHEARRKAVQTIGCPVAARHNGPRKFRAC